MFDKVAFNCMDKHELRANYNKYNNNKFKLTVKNDTLKLVVQNSKLKLIVQNETITT